MYQLYRTFNLGEKLILRNQNELETKGHLFFYKFGRILFFSIVSDFS